MQTTTHHVGATYHMTNGRQITVESVDTDPILGGARLHGRDDQGYRVTAHETHLVIVPGA